MNSFLKVISLLATLVLPTVHSFAASPCKPPSKTEASKPDSSSKSSSKPSFSSSSSSTSSATSATSKPRSTIRNVWKVDQTIPFGKTTTYVSSSALRIDGTKGGLLLARAPDWTVEFFNKTDKTKISFTYQEWLKHLEYPHFFVERSGVRPRKTTIAGCPAFSYDFSLNQMSDSEDGFGGLFRTSHKQELLRFRRITVAADTKKLPIQAVEIWRIHSDVAVIGKVPLEEFAEKASGNRIQSIQTHSQEYVTVPAHFFTFQPKGYKQGGAPFSVFYGRECEDMTQMMLGD